MNIDHNENMKKACDLAELGVKNGGGPFGCVIIDKNTGNICAETHNLVTIHNNPTLHAEIVAINNASHYFCNFDLSNCILYSSCEPCPMCLAAIYWAKIDTVYYGNTKEDAAMIGFDDRFIYDEMKKSASERVVQMTQIRGDYSKSAFEKWVEKGDKIKY